MITLQQLAITLPSLLPFTYETNTNYDCNSSYFCFDSQPPLKNIMEHNTTTMEELIKENNTIIMENLFLRTLLEYEHKQ